MDKVSPFFSKGNATRKYLRICDKHFKDSDVQRTFRTVFKDGTINEIPRERFKLNQGSVPWFNLYLYVFSMSIMIILKETPWMQETKVYV